MKKNVLNIFLFILTILVVSLSMGFNVSKMGCDDSGFLYLGSQVPSCNAGEASCCMIEIAESCCPETKDNSCSSITENIHFEFQTLINYFSFDFKQAGLLLYVPCYEARYNDICFLLYYLMEYVPLDIYNPELSQIQSFLL